MSRAVTRGARGQASVELIAIVPLLCFAALALAQAVIAGWALMSAGEAARSAARAEHVGDSAESAARSALPLMLEPGEVTNDGAVVTVEVNAPVLIPGAPGIPVRAEASLDPGGSG